MLRRRYGAHAPGRRRRGHTSRRDGAVRAAWAASHAGPAAGALRPGERVPAALALGKAGTVQAETAAASPGARPAPPRTTPPAPTRGIGHGHAPHPARKPPPCGVGCGGLVGHSGARRRGRPVPRGRTRWRRHGPHGRCRSGHRRSLRHDRRHGRPATEHGFAGRPKLVFFGFARSPGACPTTLADTGRSLDAPGPGAKRLVPLFVTVDPERDTPERSANHLGVFDSPIIGPTGRPSRAEAMARVAGVPSQGPCPGGPQHGPHRARLPQKRAWPLRRHHRRPGGRRGDGLGQVAGPAGTSDMSIGAWGTFGRRSGR